MAVSPVIFVHGLQGAWLKDEYPVDYNDAVIWTGVLTKRFDALHLHALDDSFDAETRRLVMPHQAVPFIYEGIIDEIRDEMDDQSYVYAFTYDWRKDNRLSARALGEFMERVLRIAGLHEKSAGRAKPRQVVLIGHSMGGLVIKWCATRVVEPRKIAKIITIATPFKGSLKAVEALLPGARNLFGGQQKKSMRHAARTMPGVYQLLPSWNGAVVDLATRQPLSPFDVSSWQKSLVDSLAKKYGPDFFPRKLADAKAFVSVVARPWPSILVPKVYYAYGIGSATWKQVAVDRKRGNFYMFNKAISDDQGDGTVHAASGMQREIVGSTRVKIDDSHPVTDLVPGQHANLLNHAEIQDWILGILRVNPHAKSSFASLY